MLSPLRALRLSPTARLALVGAGGKTALLFGLAKDYVDGGVSPLLTTTTHLSIDQAAQAGIHVILREGEPLPDLGGYAEPEVRLFTGPPSSEGRLTPLPSQALAALVRAAEAGRLPLLIEADGSRRRPLKAPAAHEPAIPEFVTTVAVLLGLAGIGRPLTSETVHRPQIYSDLSQVEAGHPVSVQAAARVLVHPQGGLKGIPEGARRLAVLNQASDDQVRSTGASLARELLGVYEAVAVADLGQDEPASPADTGGVLAIHERVAGVILAAGGASRFGGELKQLALWRGGALVRHVALTARQAGLDPVIVVVGARAEAVRAAVAGLPVQVVENPAWEQGQSSSLRAGLERVPAGCGGAVFLLADQPQIPATLVRALREQHGQTLAPILAPQIDGQRGNPVLFDRTTFPELAALEGDVGGRALFSRFRVSWLPWHQAGLLLDVDTPEDLDRLEREFPAG